MKEKIEKPRIVYIYFDHFKFNDMEFAEDMDFKPVTGGVYRAVEFYFMGTKSWRIIINPLAEDKYKGLIIDELSCDTELFSYEAEIIDKERISELDVSNEDINNLIEWESSDHEDIKHFIDDVEEDDQDASQVFEFISDVIQKVSERASKTEEGTASEEKVDKKQKFFDFHKSFTDKMLEISKAKNSDYAGDEDPFANFTSVGKEWAEIGFYTRMMDKMSRIKSFIKKGSLEVKDESVTDTLMDLANYCILFAGYLNQKKNG